MIDRGDIRQAIDRCSNIRASLPGAGYGQFGAQAADSLIAKFKVRLANGQKEIDVLVVRVTVDYLRSGYPHHRLPAAAGC